MSSIEKSAYSVEEIAQLTGIRRTKLYAEIKAGRLSASKCGRRTLILPAAISGWLKDLPKR